MPPVLILAGFEPFRGERVNPSWEIARRLDGEAIGGLEIQAAAKARRPGGIHSSRIAIAETARAAK